MMHIDLKLKQLHRHRTLVSRSSGLSRAFLLRKITKGRD